MPKFIEHLLADGWCRPVCVNDWGSDGWYMRATMSDSGTWGHAMQSPANRIEKGDSIEVCWPDGSITTERLKAESKSVTIQDMGNSYETTTERLYVDTTHRGIKTRVYRDAGWKVRWPKGRRA